jgi:cytochrome c peroxidase
VIRRGALAASLLLVAACDEESSPPAPYDGPPIPWDYAPFPALVAPLDNPGTPERVALGRLLFYDPVLSGDEATACVTCHSEIWGFSDGLAVSVGVDGEGPVGPGREGPNLTTRNSPTLWNVAFRASLFWDGRSSSLEDQALDPLENEKELALDPAVAVERLREIPEYVALFDEAFPSDRPSVTERNLAKALSAFQRSFVTSTSPYDQYVDGDDGALSDDQRRGMELFGEVGCASCHVPPLFESERYASRIPTDDEGRMSVTKLPADRGAFRVPTLRNLRETEPYFHDGSVETLEEAVAVEAEVAAARGEGRALDDEEVAHVVKFLEKALMSRANEPSRPDVVPSGLDVPLDGFRIPR